MNIRDLINKKLEETRLELEAVFEVKIIIPDVEIKGEKLDEELS